MKTIQLAQSSFHSTTVATSHVRLELLTTMKCITIGLFVVLSGTFCPQAILARFLNNENNLIVKKESLLEPIQGHGKMDINSLEPVLNSLEPIISNFIQTLQNVNKVMRRIGDSNTEANWRTFATSIQYSNLRMVTSQRGFFAPKHFPKEASLHRATKECTSSCAKNQSCLAFNLYETKDSYVCEMLPDNFCINKTKLAFVNWPGSTVWEKISTGMEHSCLDSRYPVGKDIPCEVLRPGCFGNWPHCSDCFKTCHDPHRIYNDESDYQEYTLWPEGDGPFAMPVFGLCSGSYTCLLYKEVNLSGARFTKNYVMSPQDMHRFSRLRAYPFIEFRFKDTMNQTYWIDYRNWVIDPRGNLMNMRFKSSSKNAFDVFNLREKTLKSTPFVTVTDDRYGCGSFWLLDSSNATYCPGGEVSMLGKVDLEGGNEMKTGISLPRSITKKKILYVARVILWD